MSTRDPAKDPAFKHVPIEKGIIFNIETGKLSQVCECKFYKCRFELNLKIAAMYKDILPRLEAFEDSISLSSALIPNSVTKTKQRRE